MSVPVLTLDDLTDDRFDTVILASPEPTGRLFGRRVPVRRFLVDGADYRLSICTSALVWDIAQEPAAGVAFAGFHTGWHDVVLRPDLGTLRPYPGAERTAVTMADVFTDEGEPVEQAPRWILKRQVERARAAGYQVLVGSELELYLFRQSYREARLGAFRALEPATLVRSDYSIAGQGEMEPFLALVRRRLEAAGIPVDACQAEYGLGQFEVNLEHADALETADRHAVYKASVKELAQQQGLSATFMAKPVGADMGSSCHLHVSLVRLADDLPAFPESPGSNEQSPAMRAFLAGLMEHLSETALLFAPFVNSYKRHVGEMAFAGGPLAWGVDNRTATFRVIGSGPSLRIEHRFAGADANPYLAAAALIASGLDGLERALDPGPPISGDAAALADVPHAPASLGDAIDAFGGSDWVAATFGKEVVEHLVTMARAEWQAYLRSVTDWEIDRGFENA
jgi:glutamine synthetase